MFFKRRNKAKSAEAAEAPAAEKSEERGSTKDETPPKARALEMRGLVTDALRLSADASSLGFKTTADLDPADGPIGQESALADIDFGLRMRGTDFNMIVLGPPASGKHAAVHACLQRISTDAETPSDWVYVTRFEAAFRPRALKLPPGAAPAFAKGVAAALDELRATLPAALDAEDYIARSRAIEEEYRGAHQDAIDALHAKAAEQNIAVLRTPLGFVMAPMHDGQVVKSEVFNQLPQALRRDVESRVGALQSELEALLASGPAVDKERRRQLAALDAETARHAVEDALEDLSEDLADVPEAAAFLADLERDLVAHARTLLRRGNHGHDALAPATKGAPLPDALDRRYLVNVVVTHTKDAGPPAVTETNPTPQALAGHIAKASHAEEDGPGVHVIRPGALHKANGGTLMMDIDDLLASPSSRTILKRALRSGEIPIDQVAGSLDFSPAPTLEPDPIALDVKVVLFGTPSEYARLAESDPALVRLFKVHASFNQTLPRTSEADASYARLIAAIAKTHTLKPIDAGGVARLIETAARAAGERDALSLEIGRIANIAREADFWSTEAGREVTTADDITRALSERMRRVHRVRTSEPTPGVDVAVSGDVASVTPGRAIGLDTVETGDLRLGRPTSVAAHVRIGQGRHADILYAAKDDGRRHTTAATILWSYLNGTYARDVPLALAATLVSGPAPEDPPNDGRGDRASLADLVALLSALADQPLRQDVALAGSIDAWGNVQPVDAINERIEGFFALCQTCGFPGAPSVLIPDANCRHLMLREDVVDAVREGRFSVHPIKTVNEALTLVTGVDAGARGDDGRFGAATVHGRAEAKLRAFAEGLRTFRLDAITPPVAQESRS